MSEPNSVIDQLRACLRAWGFIVVMAGLPIAAVGVLHYWKGTPVADFTRDPIAVGGLPFYTGFFSQLGFFFWGIAVGVCILGARLAGQGLSAEDGPRPTLRPLLVATGALTALLGMDDGLLLHEKVFPKYGIPDQGVLAAYALFMAAYLVVFARTFLGLRYLLLVTALLAFAISAGIDVLIPHKASPILLEDSAKLVGIVAWLTWCLAIAQQTSMPAPRR